MLKPRTNCLRWILLHSMLSIRFATWSAFGIGAAHLPILYAALALGGHIRVGMEDNVIFGKDENGKKIMATNQMLVQRAVEAVKLFGNQPATPAEAREILGIPPLVR